MDWKNYEEQKKLILNQNLNSKTYEEKIKKLVSSIEIKKPEQKKEN